MKQAIVIYHGPSMLDGKPIVVLATTGSSNVKTGPMLQTWIMRADMHPSEASSRKDDSSVCGQCPRRHAVGGDCYVQIVHAPRSVWESWDRQGRPGSNWADPGAILPLQQDARDHGLRLGLYGDPMAVPASVWQDLISALQPRSVVGYTHAWQNAPYGSTGEWLWFRDNIMASADSLSDANSARARGWRFFLATSDKDPDIDRAVLCPATRDVDPLTCHTCGICNGAQGKSTRASVFLVEHGMRSQAKVWPYCKHNTRLNLANCGLAYEKYRLCLGFVGCPRSNDYSKAST